MYYALAFFAGVVFGTFTIGAFINASKDREHSRHLMHVLEWARDEYAAGRGEDAINRIFKDLEENYGIDRGFGK